MTCLGGTPDGKRVWYRFTKTGEVQIYGRVPSCPRTGVMKDGSPKLSDDFTSKRDCYACPAFRGLDRDGRVQHGLTPNGLDIIALSQAEYDQYNAALKASFEDDFLPMARFMETQGGETGYWRSEHPDAFDMRAEYMRRWRDQHPGYDRENTRERVRQWRARRKAVVT